MIKGSKGIIDACNSMYPLVTRTTLRKQHAVI